MQLNTNIATSDKPLSLKTKFITLNGYHKIMFFKKTPQYVYEYLENKFIIYRISPFKKISDFLFQHVVDFDFSDSGKFMAILTDNELSLHTKNGLVSRIFDVYGAFKISFSHCMLSMSVKKDKSINEKIILNDHFDQHFFEIIEKNIPKHAIDLKNVDSSKKIHTFTNLNVKIETNKQKIKVKTRKGVEFFYKFPERISETCADTLLTKIFAASESGRIYILSLVGEEMKTLEFHKYPLKVLCLSYDEEFLFTSDGNMFCIWDVKSNVLFESFCADVSMVSSIHAVDVENIVDPIIPRESIQ
ncbi:hypothetical protein DMUE_1902 [Dictyocoela muelleri]|nr:hypothetical protein DMUE_1902 [Dictyocoela muelleri]